jgi:sugar lactone lactonase YvrE
MLPQLRELEAAFPRELAVIGVHSGKFLGERDTDNIAHAVRRHGIRHPVLNDADHRVWNAYAVRAWPTLTFIDPAGRVIGAVEGEANLADLTRVVREMVEEFSADGTLSPVAAEARPAAPLAGQLAYPGKVLGRFVADTGHGRVVDGSRTYGAGIMAAPQGMALMDEALYVADPEAHRIWRVDLATGEVRPAAGTGAQGWPEGPGDPLAMALNSPWDLADLGDGTLAVAMAGQHQIWRLAERLTPLAGTGREALVDGDARSACFAQPSGLVRGADGTLYVADSEASAIRAVDPGTGATRTLVGRGLFDFGDRDGCGDEVRLQHPLGLAWGGGALWVADSFNGKVKRCDPARREVRTVAAGLHEPGGLCWLPDGRLLVADTNAHRLVTVDV